MTLTESSGELGFKSKMKRKKAQDIPLSSLRKDKKAYEKFNNTSGFVVSPFRVKVPFEEQEFKLAQYVFTESLLDR